MLIGFEASRTFVFEHTGTENYSLLFLSTLARPRLARLKVIKTASLSMIRAWNIYRIIISFRNNITWIWHQRILFRHTDGIIAFFAATKRDLLKTYGIDIKKAVFIHEGVDRGFFNPSPKQKVRSVRVELGID